jgi:hypothetical protein
MDEILWWNNVCAHGLQDGKVFLDELHVVSGVQESVTAFKGPLCFVLPVPLSCDPYMASKG